MIRKKVALISLGCDKNRVDAEKIISDLKANGFEISMDYETAEIVIVNTCAFIKTAKEESINAIFDVLTHRGGCLEKLIVTGCLPQRNIEELKLAMPEVDLFLPIKENSNIVKHIFNLYGKKPPQILQADNRIISTPKHYAYLKIADGCNNHCTYCTIPKIRGEYVSTPINQIIEEAEKLVNNGVKELVIVAQDITNYGVDLYKKPMLVKLLKELSKIENLHTIRLHYCYPEKIDDKLIKEIKTNPKIAKYIDIPLQHISDKILKLMGRRSTKEQIINLINKLRKEIPDIVIRSTFIIGFPGESHSDFNKLLEFLKEYKLDLVGFFAYSKEEGTPAAKMKKQVFEFVKKLRLKKIQNVQEEIISKTFANIVGTVQKVLIDGYDSNTELFYGRNYMFSPDVDLYIYIKSSNMSILGNFVDVKIITANQNYLLGELV